MTNKTIYCCGCEKDVEARLTTNVEIYPHITQVPSPPWLQHHAWICDTCKNYVGTHSKTKDPTRPLGVISTQEMRDERRVLHDMIDPLWKNGSMKRGEVYQEISKRFGKKYHTGDLRSIDEVNQVKQIVIELRAEKMS